jgi:hypothetical protein
VDLYLVHYVDERLAEDYYKLAPQSRVLVPLHLYEFGHGRATLDCKFRDVLEQERDGHLWLEHVIPQDTGVRYVPMIWGESIVLNLAP